jgi:hypothetical protein
VLELRNTLAGDGGSRVRFVPFVFQATLCVVALVLKLALQRCVRLALDAQHALECGKLLSGTRTLRVELQPQRVASVQRMLRSGAFAGQLRLTALQSVGKLSGAYTRRRRRRRLGVVQKRKR